MSRSPALLALLFIAPSIAAQGRPLAIEDYYRIKQVGSPALSPDGKWVAYALGTRIEANNRDSSEVWLVPANGASAPLRISKAGAQATGPEWLENGTLRFLSGGKVVLFDPGSPGEPIAAPGDSATPAGAPPGGRPAAVLLSPDGKWTVTVRNTPPQPRERPVVSDFERRHLMRFRGVQFDWLEFQRDGAPFPVPNASDPEVSPPQELFLSPAGGGAERQLTRLGLRPGGVQWSRDGSAVLFTADSSYRDELRYEHSQLWSADVNGRVRRLSADPDVSYSNAAYSPDGRWILYARQLSTDAIIAQKLDHGAPTDLAVIPAGGGAERLLTADWDYLPNSARWSPDGKYVYFTGGIGGTTHLFRVSPVDAVVEQVTQGQRRIGALAFDRGMTKMAYTVGVMEQPGEIFVADIDGKNERQLTHVHDGFIREVALNSPDRLLFKSTDGTPIEGWLYRPYGYRADKGPYPLIVFSHGGPHAAYGYGFDFKLQYFAANGYFVLTTNFRSSTGYGENFLWATWGAWGNKDGQDVMAGVDHVMDHFPIDARHVATVGHSYGGFMSNWLITQYPDRFAAAAVGAGIVNWMSDYGTADIARTKETEFFGTPWDPRARELMIRQSPLTYANRVRAATLFINGEIDQRVPYSEAEQMYVALKKNGVPAKVIQYAGQPHGIAGSWNNVHRMLSELHWLDTWLKPAAPRPASAVP